MTYRKISGLGISLALTLLLGCGITDTTSPDRGTDLSSSQSVQGTDPNAILPLTDLLTCRPQSYVVTTKLIGPKGGKIKAGSHILDIPEGALAQDVIISAEQVTASTNSVRFGPEGLTFAVPAQLTMSYDNCSAVLLPKRIAYTTESLKVLEVLPSEDKFQTKIVLSPIDHFSRYAVAY
jgi:hypothetical protein